MKISIGEKYKCKKDGKIVKVVELSYNTDTSVYYSKVVTYDVIKPLDSDFNKGDRLPSHGKYFEEEYSPYSLSNNIRRV